MLKGDIRGVLEFFLQYIILSPRSCWHEGFRNGVTYRVFLFVSLSIGLLFPQKVHASIANGTVIDSFNVTHNNTTDRDTINLTVTFTIITNGACGVWHISESKSGDDVASANNVGNGQTHGIGSYNHQFGTGSRSYSASAYIRDGNSHVIYLTSQYSDTDDHPGRG
jgi:hypothetical protein